ncbi:MAG: cation diffusion facilitator family transporter [Verrucomicrobiota bacterium]
MAKKMQAGLAVTWLSMLVNIVLGMAKVVIGFVVNSTALMADGLHSLVDLSTDVAALFGLKMAAIPRDENHPYGHHRYASLSTLFIGFILLAFCIWLIYASISQLVEGALVNPEWPALLIAGASILIKEGLYWRTRRIARQQKSKLLMANALHHRTDSLSSVLVFVALLAVAIGGQDLNYIDKVAGIILGSWLGVEAFRLILQACNDLLDTAPDAVVINDIREHILPVEGVVAYHQFRVRQVGDMLDVDFHLQVDPELSVQEGHQITTHVRESILKRHKEVIGVLIHLEPADEEHLQESGISDRAET